MSVSTNARLLSVKIIHTLIWCVFATAVLYVLWSGITGRIVTWSWVAVGAVCSEGCILLAFKWKCPLTIEARKYSDSPKDNFDIFLPEWLARYNKLIFGVLFGIGLALMLIRSFA